MSKQFKIACYARVSTDSGKQKTDRQVAELLAYCDRRNAIGTVFEDKASGSTTDKRPEFKRMMKEVLARKFNAVACLELSRLSRSTSDLYKTAEQLRECDADLIVLNQNIDTSTASGKLLFGVLSVVAEFERDLLSERVRSGIQRAKTKGTKLGRRRIPKATERQILQLREQGLGIRKIAKAVKVGNGTVERVLKEAEAASGEAS